MSRAAPIGDNRTKIQSLCNRGASTADSRDRTVPVTQLPRRCAAVSGVPATTARTGERSDPSHLCPQRARRRRDQRVSGSVARWAVCAEDRQERGRDGTKGRGSVRQEARPDVQFGIIGAVPGAGVARSAEGLGSHHLPVDLFHRRFADRARRMGAGFRRCRTGHLQRGRVEDRGVDHRQDQGDPLPEPGRKRPGLGCDPRHSRPAWPEGHRGLLRLHRNIVAWHQDRQPHGHHRHELCDVAHHHLRRQWRHGVP